MLQRPIAGIETSAIGLGTWAIGGWMWGGTDDDNAVAAIQASIDHGVTLIDTAPIYGFGHSETVVGKAIAGRRDAVYLATKCGLVSGTDKGEEAFHSTATTIDAEGDVIVHRYLGPESITQEVEGSLQRLQTDHIDLLQTHWQEATTPIEDTMAALEKLRDQGKIRAIGACNVLPEHMERYRAAGTLDSIQEQYSMLKRDREADDLPICIDGGIAFLAYSPLVLGLLTGKITPDRTYGEGDLRSKQKRFEADNVAKVLAMLDQFKPFAQEMGLTMGQLVIAWTLHQPGVSHVLVGARNAQQAIENVGGAVELSPEIVNQMTAILERHRPNIT